MPPPPWIGSARDHRLILAIEEWCEPPLADASRGEGAESPADSFLAGQCAWLFPHDGSRVLNVHQWIRMAVNDRPLCAFASEYCGDTQVNLNRSLNSNELR